MRCSCDSMDGDENDGRKLVSCQMASCGTTVTRGLSVFSQWGTWPDVTMYMCRTQGTFTSMLRSEYRSSSLSRYRLLSELSSRLAEDSLASSIPCSILR